MTTSAVFAVGVRDDVGVRDAELMAPVCGRGPNRAQARGPSRKVARVSFCFWAVPCCWLNAAVHTLRHTLDALRDAGVLAFNVSLHGGEVTTLPPDVLDALFGMVRAHYRAHFDALNALGHRKSAPHIKTNLFKFAPLYELFDRHKVSISASIDLPLALHERHRTTRGGTGWLPRTLENIRLLARYPHAKKISATLSSEHLQDMQALVDDIWFIHRELGFDMNQFNLMFAFGSELNRAAKGEAVLTQASSSSTESDEERAGETDCRNDKQRPVWKLS